MKNISSESENDDNWVRDENKNNSMIPKVW